MSQGFWSTLFNRSDHDRIRRLESKVDSILAQLGMDSDEQTALSDEVKSLATQPRKKFAAVKLHRAQTGAGLNEAEAAVSAYIHAQRKPKRATHI